jgi:hypothetical protein
MIGLKALPLAFFSKWCFHENPQLEGNVQHVPNPPMQEKTIKKIDVK